MADRPPPFDWNGGLPSSEDKSERRLLALAWISVGITLSGAVLLLTAALIQLGF